MFTVYCLDRESLDYVSFSFKPYSLSFIDSCICSIHSTINHATCIKIDTFAYSSAMNEYQLFINSSNRDTFDRFRIFCECEDILC